MRQPKTSPPPVVDQHAHVEVMDERNRPLAVMPIGEVHRQSLPHRFVVVLVYDALGRLYLGKRSGRKRVYPGRWDVSACGHLLAGESADDAARRILAGTLSLSAERLKQLRELPPSPDTGNTFVSLFALEKPPHPPAPCPGQIESGNFHTREELDCLVREFRELLTPGLVRLHEMALAFPGRERPAE